LEYELDANAPMIEIAQHASIKYADFPLPPIGFKRVRGVLGGIFGSKAA
jgi:hypothetical protein